MKIALIGNGAISTYVQAALAARDLPVAAIIVRPGKQRSRTHISAVADLPPDIDLLIDCAGHEGLRAHGPLALAAGIDVLTLSVGALADAGLHDTLEQAARQGGARLTLASGAIGALDALRAARVGRLSSVIYRGCKPPGGWRGSPAEDTCELDHLTEPFTHFSGSAREAALAYPKNANVAASVALASLGLDATQVQLIADPGLRSNIHEIVAQGDFGEMRFRVAGNSLPDNPRSSALAAMSAVAAIEERRRPIGF